MRRRFGARSPLRGRIGLLGAALLIAIFAIAPGIANAASPPVLHVNPWGDGEGTVVQDHGQENTVTDIDCTYHPGLPAGVCQTDIDTSAVKPWDVQLHASAFAGSEFLGWTVDHDWILHGCGESTTCHLDLSDAADGEHIDVYASFAAEPDTYPLDVVKQGSGTGVVKSEPPGIDCGPDCVDAFEEGSVVTLKATAAAGSVFDGWAGACESYGAHPVCFVNMTGQKTVIAKFKTQTFPLTVALAGNGSGGVTSNLAPAISCPPNCVTNVGVGTVVTLYASANAGSTFENWTGVCAAAGSNPTCTFTMPAASTTATASFKRTAVNASLTYVKTGYFGITGRATKFSITSGEPVRVLAAIVRNGKVLAGRQYSFAPSGSRLLQLNIPTGVAAGKAQLKLTFVNKYGTEKKVGSKITIPSL